MGALKLSIVCVPGAGRRICPGCFLYRCYPRLRRRPRADPRRCPKPRCPNNSDISSEPRYIDRRQGFLERIKPSSLQRALALDPRKLFHLQQIALKPIQSFDSFGRAAALEPCAPSIVPNDLDTRPRASFDLGMAPDLPSPFEKAFDHSGRKIREPLQTWPPNGSTSPVQRDPTRSPGFGCRCRHRDGFDLNFPRSLVSKACCPQQGRCCDGFKLLPPPPSRRTRINAR